ncbi:MAG TPA: hypothetical protein VFW03_14170 [Gemmatimonadaceae bacterium]|nr:hypothetical protein [Gemmatimonadaceae bacterium]
MSRFALGAVAVALVTIPAFPCGGPGADIVDRPLVPVHDYLARTLYDDEYESHLRLDLRFLEPFRRVMPDSVGALVAFAYEDNDHLPAADADTLPRHYEQERLATTLRAVEHGDYARAEAAARRVVNDVLDMPAGVASPYAEALRTAVEVVDLAPSLTPGDRATAAQYFAGDSAAREALGAGGALPNVLRAGLEVRRLKRSEAGAYADAHAGSPRLASLRFVALEEAMHAGIPDGWASAIRDSVPPARWAEFERLHADWLQRFSSHPLADYVRLSRVRLSYFEGDNARAWDELLAMYPRHRERVLGEMRYLVQQGVLPASIDDRRLDWPLRTALLSEMGVTPEQWNAYWQASESHAGESWATAMQERLLWQAIKLAESTRSLPSRFPQRAASPTPLWAKLRLLALLEAGDLDGATEQAESIVGSEDDIGAIRVRIHLLRRDWGKALAASPVGDPATRYLVRVLAPSPVLDSLAATMVSPLAGDARLTIAGRRAAAGEWTAASHSIPTTDPDKARRWARTAALAADTSQSGRLAFARWMRDQHGRLFFGDDTFWLRGLNWRLYALGRDTTHPAAAQPGLDPRLPWTAAEERARIDAHLRQTTELYYALGAYAQWLDRATRTTPGLAAVVREADRVYNRLASWDARNSRFWSAALTDSPEARSIRRAGLLLRKRR